VGGIGEGASVADPLKPVGERIGVGVSVGVPMPTVLVAVAVSALAVIAAAVSVASTAASKAVSVASLAQTSGSSLQGVGVGVIVARCKRAIADTGVPTLARDTTNASNPINSALMAPAFVCLDISSISSGSVVGHMFTAPKSGQTIPYASRQHQLLCRCLASDYRMFQFLRAVRNQHILYRFTQAVLLALRGKKGIHEE